jgi:tRNA(adenine34) deaminase
MTIAAHPSTPMPGSVARRRALCIAAAATCAPLASYAQSEPHPQRRWYDRAEAMRQAAIAPGDQPYGAVLVAPDGTAVESPSRVVKESDANAHSERVAIREARRLLGDTKVAGAVLYSTSRPCRLCEQAAARAGVRRMYFGSQMEDAGAPRG